MTIVEVTEWGESHGLINVLANSCQDNDFKHMKPEHKAKAEKMKKEDHKIVKARYMNHRGQHERLTKPYCRWSGDPIQIWHLIPGRIYDLPLGLVNEINASGLKRRSKEDGPNANIGKVEGVDKIHELVPVGF